MQACFSGNFGLHLAWFSIMLDFSIFPFLSQCGILPVADQRSETLNFQNMYNNTKYLKEIELGNIVGKCVSWKAIKTNHNCTVHCTTIRTQDLLQYVSYDRKCELSH